MERLLSHHWRGNLRELNHTLRTVALLCKGDVVLVEHIISSSELSPGSQDGAGRAGADPESGDTPGDDDLALTKAVRRHVRAVYEHADRNQRRAAKLLGISRSTLARHLKQMHLPGTEPRVD
jgi:DNA-binding NtrC family response regulator